MRIDLERSELLRAKRKVQIAIGIIGLPFPTMAPRLVTDAHEREHILGKLRVVLPLRDSSAVELVHRPKPPAALRPAHGGHQADSQHHDSYEQPVAFHGVASSLSFLSFDGS